MTFVAVLSADNAGGVRPLRTVLDRTPYDLLLVSDQAEDLNRAIADELIRVDWNVSPEQIADDIEAWTRTAGGGPIVGVVNLLEPLMDQAQAIASRLGLPGGSSTLSRMRSKDTVRMALRAGGVSDLWFAAGRARELRNAPPRRFPVVVKPAQDSGASAFVTKAERPGGLHAALRGMEAALGSEALVLIEEYVEGDEFSVDGMLRDGVFTRELVVQKPAHDERRLHDIGVLVTPPESPTVRAAEDRACTILEDLARELGVRVGWMHAEFRVDQNERVELIEVNPRPGGGVYAHAIRRRHGVDPLQLIVDSSTSATVERERRAQDTGEILGLFGVQAEELGTVSFDMESVTEVLALSGVLALEVNDGYRVRSLEQENFVADALLSGTSYAEVQRLASEVTRRLRFDIALDHTMS